MVTHSLNSCSAFIPSKVHTHISEHTHIHREHTHPEQWAAIYAAAPGEQLGVRCLKGFSVVVLRVERVLESPAALVCLTYLTHLIWLISSLVEAARTKLGVPYYGDIQNVQGRWSSRTGLWSTALNIRPRLSLAMRLRRVPSLSYSDLSDHIKERKNCLLLEFPTKIDIIWNLRLLFRIKCNNAICWIEGASVRFIHQLKTASIGI